MSAGTNIARRFASITSSRRACRQCTGAETRAATLTIAAMRGEERREFQRLQLDPPIPGTFSATAVSLIEVGVLGCRFHHGEPLTDETGELRFWHYGDEIALKCEVVRLKVSQHAKNHCSGIESRIAF